MVCLIVFCIPGNTWSGDGKPVTQTDEAPFGAARRVGRIMDERLTECSGLEPSPTNGDLFWAINDSGNGPYLYAMGSDGRSRGRVQLEGAQNLDWEDLDTFSRQGRSMILVADTGDNFEWQNMHTLYIVQEPRITGERLDESAVVKIAWQITFSYPDGNHDAEGVAVDEAADKVFVLTKRDNQPLLFELPLSPSADGQSLVARKIAAVNMRPPPLAGGPRRKHTSYGSRPTALDLSKNGRQAVVLTDRHAYLFTRDSGDSWGAAFSRPPALIPLPRSKDDLSQREAICFAPDDKAIFVTSEGKGAGIYRLESRSR